MTETERRDIETILDEFDFCKVEKVMQALEWRWASVGCVPSIGDMRRWCRRLLKSSIKEVGTNSDWFTGSGGFMVNVTQYPGDSKKYIKLSFQVAEWSNYE